MDCPHYIIQASQTFTVAVYEQERLPSPGEEDALPEGEEMLASALASGRGALALAVGNVIGTNITIVTAPSC